MIYSNKGWLRVTFAEDLLKCLPESLAVAIRLRFDEGLAGVVERSVEQYRFSPLDPQTLRAVEECVQEVLRKEGIMVHVKVDIDTETTYGLSVDVKVFDTAFS